MADNNNQIYGVVSIHRLRTGKSVQLYLSVTGGLYQLVTSAGACTPDWSNGSSPVITPNISGVDASEITNPRWYKDGSDTPLTNEDGYAISTSKTGTGTVSVGYLKFTKSPVDTTNIHNITYTFKCDIKTGGTSQTIERSVMVIARRGGDNSYWGNINTPNGTTLGIVGGTKVSSITLSPTLWLGSDNLTTKGMYNKENGYDVVWKRTVIVNGSAIEQTVVAAEGKYTIGDNGALTVTDKAVYGAAHFECHFLLHGTNTEVEAEGVQVFDNADSYYISISGDKNVYADSGQTCSLKAGLYTHDDSNTHVAAQWDAVVTDSERMREFPKNDISNGFAISTNSDGDGEFEMKESAMYVPNTGENKEAYGAGAWIKCGDNARPYDKDTNPNGDKAVTSTSDATQCDVTVQFIATI